MNKNTHKKYLSTKKTQEFLHKFSYYVKDVFPDLFGSSFPSSSSPSYGYFESAKGSNDVLHFYSEKYVQGDIIFTPQTIVEACLKVYLHDHGSNQILKINDASYQRISEVKGGIWTSNRLASQIITFFQPNPQKQDSNKTSLDLKNSEELYVIHQCHQEKNSDKDNLTWLTFIEKYTFQEKGIKYQLVASVKDEQTFLWKNANSALFQNLLLSHSSSEQLDKMHGFILQCESDVKREIKQSNDPAYREEHNLIRKVPSQHLKIVHKLRKQFPQEKQNLLCRFLIASDFSYQGTRKQLNDYVKWRDDMKSKYKWEDFEEFHRMHIFTYLGQDFMGRPVIYNKASNVRVNEMDTDKYCIYYMFYLEIFMETKMRGNVAQVLIIGDAADTAFEHFKFSVTKKNISDCLKYGPQRQYKLIAINGGAFPHYCWKLIKPLLPKRTHEKVVVPGTTKEQILEVLQDEMEMSVIPTYLGGSNPIL